MCGAVRFAVGALGNFGVCHCRQCQRWAGSALFGVNVPEAAMRVEGAEHIGSFRSSDWATRSFCTRCGSGLWYRYDKGVDGTGDYEVPVGLLDDANGLELQSEIFADAKPDCWALEGAHERLTSAETLAKFGPQVEGT
ncbi:Gfa-like protein [Salipiger mucosus DSM 16094]|uniref:Gfa-like protein n=1 Tax=Salipiger mucosus DSM 16094 TaxID=1123237 RepID=S9R4N8_9RHOB|nr:Gfa-like protein [Salipiger mucosus DSM 16094]